MEEQFSKVRDEMENSIERFQKSFSDNQFWEKLRRFARNAGAEVVYLALLLYYVLKHPATKKADRAKIIGSLGYFILPLDLIPDWIPVAGYTDDLAALTWGIYCVARNITPETRAQAADKVRQWFGPDVQISGKI